MSDDNRRTGPDEPLLARWSRLKRAAASPPQAPPATAAAEPQTDAAPVELPSLDSLTRESDFAPFMKRGVLPELRQAALKKLFADPHFNVMDGLDIYIDDYTRPDPIAASVIDQLVQFRNLEAGGAEPPTIEGQPIAALGETECASAADSAVESPVDSMGQPDQAASPDGVAVANLPDTKSRQARQIDQTVAADVLQVSVKERKPE